MPQESNIIIHSEYYVTCYIGRILVEKVWASSSEDAETQVRKMYFKVEIRAVSKL